LSPYLEQIDEVVVGYVPAGQEVPLHFLRFLPCVSSVWIVTDQVQDLSELRFLPRLRDLAIDRPKCRMDVLGELVSLEVLYLDDWRPGAESIFRLPGLVKLGVQRFGRPDLKAMSGWTKLRELWLNAGPLMDLSGLPASIEKLRLTSLRKLGSLSALGLCPRLSDLRMESCRSLKSLAGLEHCERLGVLSISRSGPLDDLRPLRGLAGLRYVVLADGTVLGTTEDVAALYSLRNLHNLIIPRLSGVDPARIRQSSPDCDVRLTKR
jgi:hypothetical protein